MVDAHILSQSKFKENRYQSLNGVNYTYDPIKGRLTTQLSDDPNDILKFDIKVHDTCYTSDGGPFQRLLIDSILDSRCFAPGHTRKQSILDPMVVMDNKHKATKEYVEFLTLA